MKGIIILITLALGLIFLSKILEPIVLLIGLFTIVKWIDDYDRK